MKNPSALLHIPLWTLARVLAAISIVGLSNAAEIITVTRAAPSGPPTMPPNSHRMMLISRGVPAYASSGYAKAANNGEYRDWRSSGVPATLAYDLSSVPVAHRQRIYLVWYNDASYPYDHGMAGGPGYNNLGSYTVEINNAPGNGRPPESGWRVVDTVEKNTAHSRDHVIDFAGYNWVRINASASDGSTQNFDVSLDMDVYDASAGNNDGWFFFGDSITANCMGHSTSKDQNFINRVGAKTAVFPAEQNAGMPFWTTGDGLKHMPSFLAQFHGQYVTIALGTNDAAGNANPAGFYADLEKLSGEIIAAGKTPVIPTIPWSRDANHAKSIPGLNEQIRKLYSEDPRIVRGADLYALFEKHQEYISPDNIHPSNDGCLALRAAWADSAVENVYANK